MIELALIFFASLGGAAYRGMWVLNWQYPQSIFQRWSMDFWAPEPHVWENKYKEGLPPPSWKDKARYLWFYTPSFSEAYPYSTTFLVFATTGSKALQLASNTGWLCVAAATYTDPLLGIMAYLSRNLTFNISLKFWKL